MEKVDFLVLLFLVGVLAIDISCTGGSIAIGGVGSQVLLDKLDFLPLLKGTPPSGDALGRSRKSTFSSNSLEFIPEFTDSGGAGRTPGGGVESLLFHIAMHLRVNCLDPRANWTFYPSRPALHLRAKHT